MLRFRKEKRSSPALEAGLLRFVSIKAGSHLAAQGALEPDGGELHGLGHAALLRGADHAVTRAEIGVGELELDGHALGKLEVLHVLGVEHLHHDDILIRHRAVVDQIVHAAQRMTAVNEIFSHIETLLTLIPIPAHSTIARAACQPNVTKGYVRFRVFCSITGDANSTANMNSEYLSISLSFSLRSDLRDKAQPKKVPETLSIRHLRYQSQNGNLRIHRPI